METETQNITSAQEDNNEVLSIHASWTHGKWKRSLVHYFSQQGKSHLSVSDFLLVNTPTHCNTKAYNTPEIYRGSTARISATSPDEGMHKALVDKAEEHIVDQGIGL